ncbi:MAG: hypothetical protein KGH71_03070 [Candidatus Micrarchaeota archaeon]|nr:hypothetical protein [Candidatus Micrarchaeota archaeon]
MGKSRLQSAMEYLMTYGWAILVIAVVLGVLYQLGVFNFGRLGSSGCLAQSGFLCTTPIMNTSGNLSIVVGIVGTPITVTGIGCTTNSTVPSSTTGFSTTLQSNQKYTFVVQCPLSTHSLGTVFSGSLWIVYTQGAQSGIISKFASVTAPATLTGPVTGQNMYVVGANPGSGALNLVYYAPLSASGVGTWIAGTTYPISIYETSCVTNSGYIYCVDGLGSSGAWTNNVYYAPIYKGIGTWAATTSTPNQENGNTCVAYSGYITCLTARGSEIDYGQLTSNGIPTWTTTNTYPVQPGFTPCVVYQGYMYCVAGTINGSPGTLSYYAPLLPSGGVGAWTATTSYPIQDGSPQCVTYTGMIFCIGGTNGAPFTNLVYYAPLSQSGIGAWTSTTVAPLQENAHSCATSGGYVYCITGRGSEVDYAKLTATGIPSWSTTTSYLIQGEWTWSGTGN